MNICKTKDIFVVEILARFWPIFGSELNEKRSQAEPSRAENPSARAMVRTSSARAQHDQIHIYVLKVRWHC